ncbi:MFS transporter [Actinophytocola sp.]|uniref:MFS transporter n=1 Tax=Actinophytocola sp. TaxID=1872138 RepID=UPI003D6B2026
MSKRAIFGLFLPLYGSQFLAIGFLFTALAAITRERGGSLEDIGIIYGIGFVWALKFLWAPLVDKYGSRRRGHYRSWLVVTQPAAALGIVALAPLDVGEHLGLIVALLAVVAVLSATQDIATDALAVRMMHGRSRGGINGLQIGANFVGDVIGGGLVLVVYDSVGWVPAILTLAVVVAVPIHFIRRFTEPAPPVPVDRVRRETMRSLFRQPGVARWVLVLTPLLAIAMPGAYGMLVPMLIDAGVSVGAVGLLTNGLGGVIGIAAAIGAGLWIHRLGRRRALIWYGVGQAVAIATMIPLANGGGMVWALIAIVLLNVFNSAVFVVMYTINMDNSRPASAGADFTVQTSISLGLRFAAAGVVVSLAGSFGYATAMLVCTGVAVVALVAVLALYRETTPEAEAPAPQPRELVLEPAA